jgi:hypothetical protein
MAATNLVSHNRSLLRNPALEQQNLGAKHLGLDNCSLSQKKRGERTVAYNELSYL